MFKTSHKKGNKKPIHIKKNIYLSQLKIYFTQFSTCISDNFEVRNEKSKPLLFYRQYSTISREIFIGMYS